jgi:hypothetical protein
VSRHLVLDQNRSCNTTPTRGALSFSSSSAFHSPRHIVHIIAMRRFMALAECTVTDSGCLLREFASVLCWNCGPARHVCSNAGSTNSSSALNHLNKRQRCSTARENEKCSTIWQRRGTLSYSVKLPEWSRCIYPHERNLHGYAANLCLNDILCCSW